ncbi:hypothetical protein SBF1_10002 [Candidatus Desulfosporosinus infrequens]|uniref:Uncharacterized protein n=1 Tax=Candidatus Desulfosporosinus infrequens TaxID=2043169 RepID=A0A2U3JUZ0_9FIRM|nr:hypothetical protein SBF1_10002 [Candidatus Desulfosporosinus infrequens]
MTLFGPNLRIDWLEVLIILVFLAKPLRAAKQRIKLVLSFDFFNSPIKLF